MSLNELKAECRKYGLHSIGSKSILANRLKTYKLKHQNLIGEQPTLIQITLNTLLGDSYTFRVSEDVTVKDLFEAVSDQIKQEKRSSIYCDPNRMSLHLIKKVDPINQKAISTTINFNDGYIGELLENDDRMSDLKVENGAKFHLRIGIVGSGL